MESFSGPFKGIWRFLKAIFRSRKADFRRCGRRDGCAVADFILQSVKHAKSIKFSVVRLLGEFPELGSEIGAESPCPF